MAPHWCRQQLYEQLQWRRLVVATVILSLVVIAAARWQQVSVLGGVGGIEQYVAPDNDTAGRLKLSHSQGPAVAHKDKEAKKIFLFTYYRGGSSILGEMFNQNSDVFYFFEPLAGIQENLANSEEHVHFNGTLKTLPANLRRNLSTTLSKIFKCDLASIPNAIYRHRFMWEDFWNKSRQMAPYRACLAKRLAPWYHQHAMHAPTLYRITRCKPRLLTACKNSSAIVVKDIRMPMSDVGILMETIPDLRIVYQIRDPRAILNSQWPARSREPNLPLDAITMCTRFANDFRVFLKLSLKYPDRMLLFEYENFTIDPEAYMEFVYDFAGLDLPDKVRAWLWSSTHAEANNGAIGTKRTNPKEIAQKWRTKLSASMISEMNRYCEDVLRLTGYQL